MGLTGKKQRICHRFWKMRRIAAEKYLVGSCLVPCREIRFLVGRCACTLLPTLNHSQRFIETSQHMHSLYVPHAPLVSPIRFIRHYSPSLAVSNLPCRVPFHDAVNGARLHGRQRHRAPARPARLQRPGGRRRRNRRPHTGLRKKGVLRRHPRGFLFWGRGGRRWSNQSGAATASGEVSPLPLVLLVLADRCFMKLNFSLSISSSCCYFCENMINP